jgi:hypothetical protein
MNYPRVSLFLAVCLAAKVGAASPVDVLRNGGFETGDLSSWTVVTAPGSVISATAGAGCAAIDPGTPRTGSFLLSACSVDGVPPGASDVTLCQIADVASHAGMVSGVGTASFSGFVSTAEGCGRPSDSLVQLIIRFLDSNHVILGSGTTVPYTPAWGTWDPVSTGPFTSLPGTNFVQVEVRLVRDATSVSIDLGADDFTLIIDDPTSAPEPRVQPAAWGAVKERYSPAR